MSMATRKYYDGNRIIKEDDIDMTAGQEMIVTILGQKKEKKKNIDLDKYMERGKKMFQDDAQEYIRKLRDNDRI